MGGVDAMVQSVVLNPKGQLRRLIAKASEAALQKINLDEEAFMRLLTCENEFRSYVESGVRRFTTENPDYEIARTILGKDFISPEEVMRARKGVVYSKKQLQDFAESVPAQEVLKWCQENSYILVPGPHENFSLLDAWDLHLEEQNFFREFYRTESWTPSEKKTIFSDRVHSTWIALRKEPVPGSLSKSYNAQKSLLKEEEGVPNAAEVVWCVTTYKAVRDTFLFPKVFVRTTSADKNNLRIILGDFEARGDGLSLYSWSGDEHCSAALGLSSKRR